MISLDIGARQYEIVWETEPEPEKIFAVDDLLQPIEQIGLRGEIRRDQNLFEKIVDILVAIAARVPALWVDAEIAIRTVEIGVSESGIEPVGVCDQVPGAVYYNVYASSDPYALFPANWETPIKAHDPISLMA